MKAQVVSSVSPSFSLKESGPEPVTPACICSSLRLNHGLYGKKNRHFVNERSSFLSFSFVLSRSSGIHHEPSLTVSIPDETTRIGTFLLLYVFFFYNINIRLCVNYANFNLCASDYV